MKLVQYRQMRTINLIFLYERDMDGYYLIVQQERDLSDYIAKNER